MVSQEVTLGPHRTLEKHGEGKDTQPGLEEGEKAAFKSKFKGNSEGVGVEPKAVFLAEGTKSETRREEGAPGARGSPERQEIRDGERIGSLLQK